MTYCKTNPKFDAWLKHLGDLHDRKNKGYAATEDPLQNFRLSERFGIPMYKGLAVRISDKMNRWLNLVGDADKDAVGESIEDTGNDLAVYMGLFLIGLEEYKKLTPVTDDTIDTETVTVAWTPDQYEVRNIAKPHNNYRTVRKD